MKKILILLLSVVLVIWMGTIVPAAEEPVMIISYAGDVKVLPAGTLSPVACSPGMLLSKGTRVITGEESYVEIAFNRLKSNVIKVRENSMVMIKLDGVDRFGLDSGEVFTLIRDLSKDGIFQMRTPCAVCGTYGTGWSTKADKDLTTVAVFKGRVFVRGIKKDGSVMEKEFWIEEGFQREIKKFECPGELERLSEVGLSEMRKEFGEDGS
jgi:hypothetical protein